MSPRRRARRAGSEPRAARTLLLVIVTVAACGRHPAAEPPPPDARPAELLLPGGPVAPGQVGRQVHETLEKEHDRTLQPIVN